MWRGEAATRLVFSVDVRERLPCVKSKLAIREMSPLAEVANKLFGKGAATVIVGELVTVGTCCVSCGAISAEETRHVLARRAISTEESSKRCITVCIKRSLRALAAASWDHVWSANMRNAIS